MGPATPPGWELQPSSRPQRALLIALGFAGGLGVAIPGRLPARLHRLRGGQGVAAGGSVTCTRRRSGSGTGILVTTAGRMRMAGRLSPDRSPAVPGAAGDCDAARSPDGGRRSRHSDARVAARPVLDHRPRCPRRAARRADHQPAADRHPRSRRGRRAAVVVTGGERRDSVAVRPISVRFLSSSSA
jgi:hypothetical protein